MHAALILLLVTSANPKAEKLHKEATAAFRAKKYAVACPKFEEVTRLEPSGAAWADLGLCLQRLGKNDEAIAANHQAIAIGDEKDRLHAYYNLGQLGVRVKVPGDLECAPLAPGPDCRTELHGCTQRWNATAGYNGAVLILGLRDLKITPELQKLIDASEQNGPSLPLPSVNIEEAYTPSCAPRCPLHWSCETSEEVQHRVQRCARKKTASDCEATVCSEAEEKPWPALVREKQRINADVDKCFEECSNSAYVHECAIVYASACLKRVGVFCDSEDGRKKEAREIPLEVSE